MDFGDKEEDTKYVSCYNCTGKNMRSLCGMPQLGCELCKKYGEGWGKLLKEYSTKPVEVTYKDYTGKSVTKTFTPPKFKCLWCEDTKIAEKQIWDEALVSDSWSDHGSHLMPRVKVACFKCCPEAHEKEYAEAKKRYFAGREETTKGKAKETENIVLG